MRGEASTPRRVTVGRAALALGALVLAVGLAVPSNTLGVPGTRTLFLSFEVGVALLGLAVVAQRAAAAAWVRRLVVALYALLLLFLFYENLFASTYHREPALVEDWRMAINLVHFLSEMRSWQWHALIWGSVLGAVVLVVLLDRFLAVVQKALRDVPRRRLQLVAALWFGLGGLSALLGGPVRLAGKPLIANYRASVAARAGLAELRDNKHDDRYEPLMKVRLAKRPNVYFLVIEAYGEVLSTWDMATSYRDLMARSQAVLTANGYKTSTAYSTAPVHGGRSWLSTSTMQTGILIDQPTSYAAFEAASRRIPTLAGFFKEQGYHTASLEPGTKARVGVSDGDLYGHETRVDATRLEYTGEPHGFGGIPDQYSLETFRARFLPGLADPRYVFYMTVSTHFPWTAETVPSYHGGGDWPPLAGESAIGSDLRRWYVRSIEYTWRILLDLLVADRSPDIVVVVLGDHQPRLESNQPGEVTLDSPLHVLSRDGAFVDRFTARGFEPGLYAEPGRREPLLHQGLFSLLVTELAMSYGTPETAWLARYYPNGISLGGLNR
jgi:phosphoglycerol transferase MdoB-like AlkP superfamily enzyme